ncbi:LYR motif-containing protein 4 [Trichomycterus rosablanca]|uniref:LYR motif-containing protein 4 n=1 Tax=Trichomycterus rosablanca TaxID=2290929 RepID=UPI002F34F1B4
MAVPSRTQVLSLYRLLLKESNNFPSYNFRTYALRRVRDAFREHRCVEDPKLLDQLLNKACENLAIIQRQVAIGKMYETQRTVVESEPKKLI